MLSLKEYVEESLLDNEADFIDPVKNIKVDVKNIKDSLKTTNFKRVPKNESGKFYDLWKMKNGYLKLTNNPFILAGINEVLSNENPPAPPGLHISFRKTNDDRIEYRKSTIKLGIIYYDATGEMQIIRKDIYLDYDEYQAPKDFIKYLKNLFKDEMSVINTFKDMYNNGEHVDRHGFVW